jgi:hypothetical protein
MKKNDWILLVSAATYSYLFYRQGAGINFLIFTVLLIILLIIRNKEIIKNRNWLLAAIGSLFSACCIFYYGDGLSVLANIISLMLLSALSCRPETSVVTSLFFSVYSIAASFVFVIIDWIKRTEKKAQTAAEQSGFLKFALYVFPFLIVLLFFLLYKGSNPLFNNFTKNITFDFISVPWILFTLGGTLLLYGFYYHKTIQFIAVKDESAPNSISQLTFNNSWFARNHTIENEVLSGVILLSLLNALLLVVNALDLNYLWFNGQLPEGLTYSSFVHQGTGLLIFSIIVAILIIMFYFRGNINLYKKNKTIKLLAFCWIIQNASMIISTALRNNLYINEYSLTYKRIGVYIWLLLALIGLMVTFIKILRLKTNWYLFRTNSWLFYGVLIISCFVSWDSLVTNFNIKRAISNNKALDKYYLLSLSDKNLPELLTLADSIKNESDPEELITGRDYRDENVEDGINFKRALDEKLFHFMEKMSSKDWKSFNISDQSVYNEILQLNNEHKIISLTFKGMDYHSIIPVIKLNNLKHLKLVHAAFDDLRSLNEFKKLETLDLSDNQINNLYQLPFLANLKELNISQNNIENISIIIRQRDLESLDISGNDNIRSFSPLIKLKRLKHLKIGKITVEGYSTLQHTFPDVKIDAEII